MAILTFKIKFQVEKCKREEWGRMGGIEGGASISWREHRGVNRGIIRRGVIQTPARCRQSFTLLVFHANSRDQKTYYRSTGVLTTNKELVLLNWHVPKLYVCEFLLICELHFGVLLASVTASGTRVQTHSRKWLVTLLERQPLSMAIGQLLFFS